MAYVNSTTFTSETSASALTSSTSLRPGRTVMVLLFFAPPSVEPHTAGPGSDPSTFTTATLVRTYKTNGRNREKAKGL